MEIYLVRHTKPLIDKDICYGQTDIVVDDAGFPESAKLITSLLPEKIDAIYSSPLIRCGVLAEFIKQEKYPSLDIAYSHLLKEINFGEWENKKWDDINQIHLSKWMNDFVNEPVPGGESFNQLYQRVKLFITAVINSSHSAALIITHAGVIRAATTYIQQSGLKDAFAISCEYGCVTKFELNDLAEQVNILR
ncbi:MAG: cobC [Ferruginibacter sp.]|uniref:alpha-ribazole phosphatase n=1 Tax=Ferruginibacter sp. TaxID=1940288 RepID=UPI002659A5B1|nr:alpha-ribazole phosphatase [Ferruginibacter sp.]MDB5280654.1 cobC [Ferruginibacter sp.]